MTSLACGARDIEPPGGAIKRLREIGLAEAGELLHLPVDAVEALVAGGYLAPMTSAGDGLTFAFGDLKAFLARNEGQVGENFLDELEEVDPMALLEALDERVDEMAQRAFEIFSAAFPEAADWGDTERNRFVDQARKRFEAILAVTGQGEEVDEALVGDLQEVGGAAARAGSPLPQLLVVLRISRDLVVQTAVEVAEERGRHWGLALSLLLTRVLPAMDRLTDALAQGYWASVVAEQEEARARYENVVENSSDGVYEVDLEGCIQYANPSLATILGVTPDHLDEARLTDVVAPVDGGEGLERLTSETAPERQPIELTVFRADGIRRNLEIRTLTRRENGEVVGYQGVVRDVTASHELEAAKNEFLALITHDLRNPLTIILGLGVTLESYAPELPVERLQRMGGSIRSQAERISRLADDLYDVSRMESQTLLLNLRAVDLSTAVEAALHSVPDSTDVQVRVEAGLAVHADPRRLEQVVANLVENALVHGSKPVLVTARGDQGGVELAVRDHGPGVPAAVVPTLFSRLRTLSRPDRDRTRGTGLGLALVRGLVEAMGGRVWYETAPGGGALFRITLPTARGG